MNPKTAFSMRGIAALALLCLAVSPAAGQQQTPQPQQKEHVVRKGDTLWDIARTYFNDPYRWPSIFNANKKIVANPHWIYPAERLVIPRDVAPELLGRPVAADTVATVARPAAAEHTRFYTPPPLREQPTLITSEVERAGVVQPMEWLGAPWVADSGSLNFAARVYKSHDPSHQRDRLTQTFHPQDKLFISVLNSSLKKGDRLLAVRQTRNLRGWGLITEPKAVLVVDSVSGNTAVAMVGTQFSDLQTDDYAIMLPAVPKLPGHDLVDVTGSPEGEILDFLLDQPLVGTTEYGFVTLGADKGVAIGDEMVAFVPEKVPDGKRPERLPEQPVGRLRVVRVTDRVATVRVLSLQEPALKPGLKVRVSRKAR